MPYKTNDADGILPVDLHEAAKLFAKEVTGEDRPTMESGIFIETFKACFQIMQELGMVKDRYMMAEKQPGRDEEE